LSKAYDHSGVVPTAALVLSYVPVVAAVSVVFAAVASRHGRLFRRAGALALAGHVFVAVVVLHRLPFRWDIDRFHNAASQVLSGSPIRWTSKVDAFAPFQAALYAAFGADPAVLAVVNGLLAVLLVIPLAYIARRLYVRQIAAEGTQLVVLFLPLSFILLTVPMRDAMGVFILFVSLAALVRTDETGSLLPVIGAIPLTVWLATFRIELAVILVFGAAAGLVIRSLDAITREPIPLRTLGLIAALPGTVAILVRPSLAPLDRLSYMASDRASGGAAYLAGPGYQNVVDLLLAAPGRALYFQFAPFPLHVADPFHGLAAIITVVLVALAVAALRSMWELRLRRSVAAMILVVYLFGIVGYGVADSNFGTTVRHRIAFSFLLCVFAAPVLDRWLHLLPESARTYLGAWPDDPSNDSHENDEAENPGG